MIRIVGVILLASTSFSASPAVSGGSAGPGIINYEDGQSTGATLSQSRKASVMNSDTADEINDYLKHCDCNAIEKSLIKAVWHHWHRNEIYNQPTYANADELFANLEAKGYEIFRYPDYASVAHQLTNQNNVKIGTADGFEYVYDPTSGEIVANSIDMGTYNISPPTGVASTLKHMAVDVFPYIVFGNTPNDPLTAMERFAVISASMIMPRR